MKILITGGAGFIGSHLSDKYTKEGHTVLCLDNFMNENLTNIRHLLNYRNFKLISGDIRDFDLLEKIMRAVDVVFHLAAQIHVDRSIIEPKLTYGINVLGTQNILEVARMYDVEKVIHASTSEVYGSAQYVPIDEKQNVKHVYHLYPILLNNYNRDDFIEKMQERGIGCGVHFIPLHLHPFYKNTFSFKKGDFSNAEWVYEREISLPLYPLMKNEDLTYIIENIKEVNNGVL